jgi:hypothetical protein
VYYSLYLIIHLFTNVRFPQKHCCIRLHGNNIGFEVLLLCLLLTCPSCSCLEMHLRHSIVYLLCLFQFSVSKIIVLKLSAAGTNSINYLFLIQNVGSWTHTQIYLTISERSLKRILVLKRLKPVTAILFCCSKDK